LLGPFEPFGWQMTSQHGFKIALPPRPTARAPASRNTSSTNCASRNGCAPPATTAMLAAVDLHENVSLQVRLPCPFNIPSF
jgi:hypothetical protein